MPRERIAMLKIEEILRLRYEAGRTQREIARSCGMAHSSVHNVLTRAKTAGRGQPSPAASAFRSSRFTLPSDTPHDRATSLWDGPHSWCSLNTSSIRYMFATRPLGIANSFPGRSLPDCCAAASLRPCL